METFSLSTLGQTSAHSATSHKYSFVSTASLLGTFLDLGWSPVAAQEKRCRVESRRGFQSHTVVLANTTLESSLMTSTTLPRIMVKNSHDGSSSLQLLSGLFERICANGLVVGASSSDLKIRHLDLSPTKLVDATHEVVTSLTRALELSEKMKAVFLSVAERQKFAQDAIELAFDGEKYAVNPDSLLYSWRSQQRADNLWNTFNVVQEHIVRGGVRQKRKDGTSVRSRPISSIDRNIAVNRGLWDLAEARLQ